MTTADCVALLASVTYHRRHLYSAVGRLGATVTEPWSVDTVGASGGRGSVQSEDVNIADSVVEWGSRRPRNRVETGSIDQAH